jgi:hypothetical protein
VNAEADELEGEEDNRRHPRHASATHNNLFLLLAVPSLSESMSESDGAAAERDWWQCERHEATVGASPPRRRWRWHPIMSVKVWGF